MVSDASNKGRFSQISASNEECFRGDLRDDNHICFQVDGPSGSRSIVWERLGSIVWVLREFSGFIEMKLPDWALNSINFARQMQV